MVGAASVEQIRRLEQLTLSTAPALAETTIDGWRVRASATDTRRANSATCLDASSVPLATTIAAIEQWFDAHHQAKVFRMTAQLSTPGMDELLAARGYQRRLDTLLMTRSLRDRGDHNPSPVGELEVLSLEAGLALLHTLTQLEVTKAAAELRRQQRWQGAQRLLALRLNGELAAIGLGRIEDGYLGVFSMHTVLPQRGHGHASRILAALAHWGAGRGAHTAFLQVDVQNKPALALYQQAGFVAAYSYWHRILETSY